MSLLLDALKRAEQEKLARGQPAKAPQPQPAAREAPTPRMAPVSSPGLELQPIGSGVPQGPPRTDAGAHAANAVFQAKAPPAPEQRSRGMLWATIGAVIVVVIAAGAYVWYSVRSLTSQVASQPQPRPRPGPTLLPPPAGAPAATIAEAAPPSIALPGMPARPATSPATSPPPAPPTIRAPAAAAPAPTEDAIARLMREAATEPQPLRLDRTPEGARRVPAEVASAYEALRQGNLAAARRGYESAIASDPGNLDARLGLATLDARSGNRSAAAAHYRRALDSDPRNATAAAGLAALADFARPDVVEGQLRADIERTPASSALHFTLGSLLAAQGRWHEAQAEFFEAHRLDPGSADVLYNLAVSLDHLGQARVAAGFYRRALESAASQGAQFDPAPVARRLAEIR